MSKRISNPLFGGAVSCLLVLTGSGLALLQPASAQAAPAPSGSIVEGGDSITDDWTALVTNGDFASGTVGWVSGSRGTSLRVVRAGNADRHAAELRRRSPGRVVLTDSPDVRADSVAGDTYAGSVFVRSATRRLSGRVIIRELSPERIVVKRTVRRFETGPRWTEVPYRVRASRNGSHFDIRVTASQVKAGNALLVDDVTMSHRVVRANQAPVPQFSSLNAGLSTAADASASVDKDGSVTAYAWDFGDGQKGTGVSPDHVYASAGSYPVRLSVTDNGGKTASVTRTVVVTTPTSTVKARDAFQRQVASGWGSAEKGGAWTLRGPSSAFSVANGAGRLTTPAGQSLFSELADVVAKDVVVTTEFSVDKLVEGNYVALTGRQIGSDAYVARLRLQADGQLRLHLLRNYNAAGSSLLVPGLTVVPGESYKLSLQVTGTSPTTLAAKVWKATSAEPTTWQVTGTDNYAPLQAAGRVGVFSYLPSGAAAYPVTVGFHNLLVAEVSVPITDPEPTNQPPAAAFAFQADQLTAAFDASTSTDADGTVASYSWNFGDGSTGSGATPVHTYAAAGTYPVTLTVTDDDGATAQVTKQVSVEAPNQPPVAAFTTTANDLSVSLDASGSSDADGTIKSYAWDYGNGATGSGIKASYTYSAAGTYQVKLTVTDDDGGSGSLTKTVTVVAPNQPPTVAFTATANNLSVSLDASGSSDVDGTIKSYAWDYGNGATGSGVKASYTYSAAGTYQVKLTVTDDDGDSRSLTKPVTVTAPQSTAGSAPVGSTSYPVPAGAVFAVAGGGSGGSGTQASPYQSAQTAITNAPNGATVVLRGGVYHEKVQVPFNKKLVIQSYPNEAVWFDGAGPVTGWVKSGSTWVVSNWTYIFDNRVSFGQGMDESSRYVDPAYPMAGYPDQVWIDGVELKQVGSAAEVVAGKFYVDRTNKRLVIGNDPTGRKVEASKLQKALQIDGAGSTIRGIGVRRYAPHLAAYGAVSAEVNDLTLENVVVLDSATIGLSTWGDRVTLRNLTLNGNGLLGLHADSAPGLVVSRVWLEGNNDERFKEQPVSGGAKLTKSDGVRVVDSVMTKNTTYGLWFDVSMRNVTVTGNRITDNGGAGVLYELSASGVIANNYIARNGDVGIWLFDSNDVQIWNNTLDKNYRSIQVLEDDRTQENPALVDTVPWNSSDIDIHNNVIVYGTNFCPILTQHLSNKWTGAQFGITSNGNVFHRVSATSPSRFACWANGAAGTKSFSTLAAFTSETGNDVRSRVYEGTGILTSSGALTAPVTGETTGVPFALPTDVAAATGKPAGDRSLGAYLVR